jgi:membrane protease YdiL (CAAX protease family)
MSKKQKSPMWYHWWIPWTFFFYPLAAWFVQGGEADPVVRASLLANVQAIWLAPIIIFVAWRNWRTIKRYFFLVRAIFFGDNLYK